MQDPYTDEFPHEIQMPPFSIGNPPPASFQIAQTRLARMRYARALPEEDWNRASQDRIEAALMERPVTMAEAYRVMGLFLGALPPAAIFLRMFGYGVLSQQVPFPSVTAILFFAICLFMNLVCLTVGYYMGSVFNDWLTETRIMTDREGNSVQVVGRLPSSSFHRRLPVLGLVWGIVTGGAGGVWFLGYGAIGGIICAVPVGIVGFFYFGILHRKWERDGMIELRRARQLALGISLAIAALILIFPWIGWR